MYQTRSQTTTKLPIKRKGTKYVARASSHYTNCVPVVVAVRDMLKLAKTAKEVEQMIKQKLLKINNKPVKDYHESIKLFNIFLAGKLYKLLITPEKRFVFKETKNDHSLHKVINKTLLSGNKIQLNLHDGSNLISQDKIKTNDSIYIKDKKISKHIPFEKGSEVFTTSGKHIGLIGKIISVQENKVKVKFNGQESQINISHLIAQ